MSIVSEWARLRVWAGLVEEVERQIREDDARGPEPEPDVVVTRTVVPGRVVWPVVSAPPLVVLGADEVRVRVLLRGLGVVL